MIHLPVTQTLVAPQDPHHPCVLTQGTYFRVELGSQGRLGGRITLGGTEKHFIYGVVSTGDLASDPDLSVRKRGWTGAASCQTGVQTCRGRDW